MDKEKTPYERGKEQFKHRLDWIKSHPIDSAMADGYNWCKDMLKTEDEQNECDKGVYDGYVDTLTPEEQEKHKKIIAEARETFKNSIKVSKKTIKK